MSNPTTKTCRICKESKSLDEFHRCRKWRASYCKTCQSKFAKQWQKDNADYVRAYKKERFKSETPIKKWERHLSHRYGITVEDYNLLSEQQGNVCAICKRESQRLRLSVDHCHSTGAIRGLLCERCNSLLGRVKDNPKILEDAAAYLRVWVAK